ncbi:MAG: peptide chain release factor N(5)-glutamine methyltransferase [Actinobacteria bacterium]|nr:peptide chain release factor N(5)-glutamine methyltransferase [Actinomycetota bacterium]
MIEAALDGRPMPPTGYFDDDVREVAKSLASRRVAGEPLQYVTGIAGFRKLELAVGPGVFVPRPESEVLVDHALTRLPDGGTLVDIGTGSGAIALAIADERSDAKVFGTDASRQALDWALANKSKLTSTAEFLEGDLFEPLPEDIRGAVDVVVSNPPYIADDERTALPVDVVDHEPHVALFSGSDGTSIIQRIAPAATEWLRPGGWVLIEISPHLQTVVPQVLHRHGYTDVTVHPDLAERPRVVEARRP